MFLKNDQNMYSIIVFITAIDNILTETCMNYKMAEKENGVQRGDIIGLVHLSILGLAALLQAGDNRKKKDMS